jgi:hypothetical protein
MPTAADVGAVANALVTAKGQIVGASASGTPAVVTAPSRNGLIVASNSSASAGAEYTNTLTAPAATDTPIILKGASSQSADMLTIRDSGNVDMVRVGSDGGINVNVTSSRVGLNVTQTTADGNPVLIDMDKSRNATRGSQTILQNGDGIGYIRFRGSNGSGMTEAASISASVDGTPGSSNDMPGRIAFATTPDGSGSPTERMRIDSAGLITGTGTSLGAWTSYTPTLTASTTNPNLGSTGSTTGAYCRIGKLVVFRVRISFGGTGVNAGSGYYRVALPVTGASVTGNPGNGSAWMYDASAGARHIGVPAIETSVLEIIINGASGFPAVQHNSPWTWAADDTITICGIYEAA